MSASLLPTYARADLAFERGEGARLFTETGESYLDFASGIAVTGLGHAHPHLVAALTEQAQRVWHTSNVFRVPGQERLADRLVTATFADRVFFANSGAEANEAAIKMARKYHAVSGRPERYRILTFSGAFHGRTLATLAAGGQAKYLEGFGPKVEGFDQIAAGDERALRAAIGPETAAVLVEPIQGEGGVRPMSQAWLKSLRQLCDQHGILLLFDEVQTGIGRTGHLFAYQAMGVEPDILASAKGLGGGFPMGACLATEEAAKGMTAGTHGTTFGGNPLAMAVGNAVLDVVLADGFLERVREVARLARQKLSRLIDEHPGVFKGLRGEGLLLGLECVAPNMDVVSAARDHKLLVLGAGDNVVRLLPPLIIGEAEIDEAVERLDAAARDVEARAAVAKEGALT